MISETTFSRDYASFWRLTTPMMDSFIRRLNRGTYDRDFEPMHYNTDANRRAFVNEVAFHAFIKTVAKAKLENQDSTPDEHVIPAAAFVQGTKYRAFQDGDYSSRISEDEVRDAAEQVNRLKIRLRFSNTFRSITCSPKFRGCGIIDECEGDLAVETTLFEIKAGDRLFRSIDLRQILIYLALNHANNGHPFQYVGLINPRVGISFEMPINEFCFEVSGRHSSQLLDVIVHSITSGDVSR